MLNDALCRMLSISPGNFVSLSTSAGGVKVSIVAFQAIDPGSIPGRRTFCFLPNTFGNNTF